MSILHALVINEKYINMIEVVQYLGGAVSLDLFAAWLLSWLMR